jgi:hypothetical protein
MGQQLQTTINHTTCTKRGEDALKLPRRLIGRHIGGITGQQSFLLGVSHTPATTTYNPWQQQHLLKWGHELQTLTS